MRTRLSRAVRVGLVAVAVVVGGAPLATAATIDVGTLSVVSDGTGVFLEITNETQGDFRAQFGQHGVFTNLNLRTWIELATAASSLDVPTVGVMDSVLMGDGSVRYTTSPETLLTNVQDPIPFMDPLQGLTFSTQYLPPFAGAFAVLTFDLYGANGGRYSGLAYVDPLDLSTTCPDGSSQGDICASTFITYQTADSDPVVPEPTTLALLGSGLGALLVRRRRRE
jgi:hypothetical protein